MHGKGKHLASSNYHPPGPAGRHMGRHGTDGHGRMGHRMDGHFLDCRNCADYSDDNKDAGEIVNTQAIQEECSYSFFAIFFSSLTGKVMKWSVQYPATSTPFSHW